jgi:hypothetical protein
LVQKVAVGSVYLDTVEPGLYRILCCLGVELDVLFDLCNAELPGKDMLIAGDCGTGN